MQDLEQAIRERAYHLWIADGCRDGNADAHWLIAQREILVSSLARFARVTWRDRRLGPGQISWQQGREQVLDEKATGRWSRWRGQPSSRALWSLGSQRRIQCHGGANERLQRLFINLVALVKIDGTPGVAFEAGVEEA